MPGDSEPRCLVSVPTFAEGKLPLKPIYGSSAHIWHVKKHNIPLRCICFGFVLVLALTPRRRLSKRL